MSRKTDIEFTEHQKEVGLSFIHVSLFNGWDTKMDIFIDENFEYKTVFSNIRRTIKQKGKLSDYLIEILQNLIYNANIEFIKAHYKSGWDDLGIFCISFPCSEKRMQITIENPIGNEEVAKLLQDMGNLTSENIKFNEDEKILFQVKREFDRIFIENAKHNKYK